MSYDAMGPGGLDYLPCRYGSSKIMFRGPRSDLSKPYIAFFGGTETYGKFIEKPYPALVNEQLDEVCVNFGCVNAGVEAFASDPHLLEIGSAARVTVIEALGAQNMSNRFYSVHPRRNDRFVRPSTLMEAIFRDVDFAEFNFTKHLVKHLKEVAGDRFKTLKDELQHAWVARMQYLLKRTSGKTILLWFGTDTPEVTCERLASEPWFVTREMIESLRDQVTEIVEVTASREALATGTEGMVFTELERPAAQTLMGPAAHVEAANALVTVIRRIL